MEIRGDGVDNSGPEKCVDSGVAAAIGYSGPSKDKGLFYTFGIAECAGGNLAWRTYDRNAVYL